VRGVFQRRPLLAAALASIPIACGGDRPSARQDAKDGPGGTVQVHVVNRATRGMATRVRWTYSPDHRALVVIDDPVSVENEPVPNAFIFVRESDGLFVQRDSAWDVAPSPDWTRLAWVRAHVTPPGERDTMRAADWQALASAASVPDSVARRQAFPVSAMTTAYALGTPRIIDLREGTPPGTETEHRLPYAGVWQVRWSYGAVLLGLGTRPMRAQDDALAERWSLVEPGEGVTLRAIRADSLSEVPWQEGPRLERGTPIDLRTANELVLGPSKVVHVDGTIRLVATKPGGPATVVVGPGRALAATATGRFIVALVPGPSSSDPSAMPYRVVVYQIPK
jgi:hypothetical protein